MCPSFKFKEIRHTLTLRVKHHSYDINKLFNINFCLIHLFKFHIRPNCSTNSFKLISFLNIVYKLYLKHFIEKSKFIKDA